MKINQKLKKAFIIFTFISIVSAAFLLLFRNNSISVSGEYILLYSSISSEKGGMLNIDKDGNLLANKPLEVQDVLFYDLSNEYFIASGVRKNNNVLISRNGDFKEIFLLNNKDYSGVLAVKMQKDRIVAIMNGGIDNGSYSTLLVVQDVANEIVLSQKLDIYPYDMIILDDLLFIVGQELNSGNWSAKIITYNLKDKAIISETVYPDLYTFKKSILVNKKLYCITTDLNYETNFITIVDAIDYKIVNSLQINDDMQQIYVYQQNLVALSTSELYLLNCDLETITQLTISDDMSKYINSSIIFNNSLYCVERHEKEDRTDGYTYYGNILKVNLDEFTIQAYTPIKLKKIADVENIVIMPTSFLTDIPM